MPLLYVPTIYVLMLSVMVLLGALTFSPGCKIARSARSPGGAAQCS